MKSLLRNNLAVKSIFAPLLALSQFAFSAPANAQEFPTKPITLVVAFAAGGNNDLRARQIGVPLSALLGKPVIVDNKPGASGNIGHEMVARASADGYTLGIGAMGPLADNPYVWKKVNFNPLQDFTPIVLVEKAPLVLVTRADKPFRSVKDVVAAAKASPGSLNIGNAGAGGAHHLSAEYSNSQPASLCCRFPARAAARPQRHCCRAKST